MAIESNLKEHQVIVTLVHGTFAKNAPWTNLTSTLCQRLQAAFGSALKIEHLAWSGKNLMRDRREAASKLSRILASQPSDAKHFVIAHSHGGSVLAYCLNEYPEVAKRVNGAVFLATPFVDACVRPGWEIIATGFAFAIFLLISGVTFAALIICDEVYRYSNHHYYGIASAFAVGAALGISGVVASLISPKRVSANLRIEALARSISTSALPHGHYLFLRTTGDEAASALSGAQFTAWLMRQVIGELAVPLRVLSNSAWTRLAATTLALSGLIAMDSIVFDGNSPDMLWRSATLAWFYKIPIEVMGRLVSHDPVGALMMAVGGAVSIVCFGTASFMTACNVVAWLGLRAVGIRSFVAAMLIDLAIEPLPLGNYSLHRTGWPTERSLRTLSHSAVYDTHECLAILEQWLVTQTDA